MLRRFEAYMRRRAYSLSTRRHRAGIVRRWLAYIGEQWRTATFHDVEAFAAALGVSPKTQRAHLSNLRAFYRWACREGLVDIDPVELVEMPRLPQQLPRPADDVAIAQVLRRVVDDAQLAAMIGLMATAGLRCCEVAALDWADVSLLRAEAVVQGKGSKQRIVYLGDDAVRLLAALDGIDGPVFRSPHRHGAPYSAHRISQLVAETFRGCGFDITAHQLRHRAATEALAGADGDLLAVRDMLGHASVATTQLYTRIASRRTARVARAVPLPR